MSRSQTLVLAGIAVLAAAAGVAYYTDWAVLLAFGLATLALAGLAWVVSFATEEVGQRFGPATTGVLQTTLGNLPELFVVIFALKKGEVVVAQTSLVGSILANALLVLGVVILAGVRASDDGVMRFKARLPNDTATLLMLTVFIIVMVGLSLSSGDAASHHVKAISTIAAGCLLAVYIAWVIPYVRSEAPPDAATKHTDGEGVPFRLAVALLVTGGAGSAFVSDWFVSALRPAIDQLHISAAFAGLVIVAIAGNAVENVAGVVLAAKGKADLAISIVKNSVSQIAAFLFPVLVLVSLLFTSTLTFALAPVYIGALALTAISVWQITGDGEAVAFEGLALIALYVMVGAVALYE
jgi:Ca2+:H+ antiporter